MNLRMAVLARHSAQTLRNVASQVIVSVVTAICVAVITNAYLKHDAAPHPAPIVAVGAAVDSGAGAPEAARKAAVRGKLETLRAVDDSSAGQANAAHPALPKLETVYIPTVPQPVAPTIALGPGVQAAEPSLERLGRVEDREPDGPKRVRLLGIPLPGLGAARDKVASLLGAH